MLVIVRRFGNSLRNNPLRSNARTDCHSLLCSRNVTTLSEKLKDTVINKWGKYWKDLFNDYYDVLKETCEHARDHPKKTTIYFSLLGFSWVCLKSNPDELNFRENVVKYSNEVLLVAKPVRNPSTDKFLTSLETCYNLGILHRLNFGFFSAMWVDNHSSELGIYQNSCSYLKPRYLTFYSRVVDVGFLGKWWKLDKVMQDYDVNPDHWEDKSKNNDVPK